VEYAPQDILVKKDNREFTTLACISDNYRQGREVTSFEKYYTRMKNEFESPIDFAERLNITEDVCKMFVFDYIICNLDRHGKNIELFLDTLEMTPLFDNGLSLLSKIPEENIRRELSNERGF
jgi:hypothetical protein